MIRSLCALLLALAMLAGCALGEEAPAQPASGVTYEIFVASFQDSDGDGRGDLRGVIDRLDYIESLGVSRIWLMPIHPSVSYHKYDVMNYCAIDPAYGTMADFDALTAACRERGIGVMLDLVVNHTSKLHPWFLEACQALRDGIDSPTVSWYNFTRGEGQHQVSGTDWYYEGQFGDHMPDLNLDNPDVRAEIARIITFWQKHGVTGFRLDAVTSYYTGANDSICDFLTFVCDTARANDPDCCIVGEVWSDEGTILDLYRSGIDSLFNFPFSDNGGAFVQAALNAKGAAAARLLAEWNGKVKAVSPLSMDAPFLTNHDQARAAGMLRLKAPFEKTAAMLYLLAPGCPTVYYGEELGMTGSGRDENKRLPMVWSAAEGAALCNPPADADQNQRLKEGVDVQDGDPDSLLNWYRQLIALRNLAPELIRGDMTAIDLGNPAVACWRVEDEGSAVLALVNTHQTEAATVSLAELGALTLLGSVQASDSPAPALAEDGSVTLTAVSCLLLRAE